MESTQELIETMKQIVCPLADKPDDVQISIELTSQELIIHISVANEDFARLLSKGNRTIRSLRILAQTLTKSKLPVVLEVIGAN
jgi:predicted RNA-binding protein YlqC (UPF0109 family)